MSAGKEVTHQDIQLVQNLIERCLQLYMNQKEVVHTLSVQAKIDPGFTELVWQKLEDENREFFKAYHVRLILKNQIVVFNKLLEKQAELMGKLCQPVATSACLSNGSTSATVHQSPSSYVPGNVPSPSRADNILSSGCSSNAFLNGGTSRSQGAHIRNGNTVQAGRMGISSDIPHSQNSNVGMLGGMNGITVKPEPNVSENSKFEFCTENSFLGTHTSVDDASGPSFSGGSELSGTLLNDSVLDADTPSYEYLTQMPRTFSFSDLTDDFATDILATYGRSPFLASENNFSESPDRECKGENRRLDTISEGINYEDFGSD